MSSQEQCSKIHFNLLNTLRLYAEFLVEAHCKKAKYSEKDSFNLFLELDLNKGQADVFAKAASK